MLTHLGVLALMAVHLINFYPVLGIPTRKIFHHDLSGDNMTTIQVCSTSVCRYNAEVVRKNMDLSVDPCDNFYQFACGGFLKSATIPDDSFTISHFTSATEKVFKQLRISLEMPSPPNEIKPFKLAKKLYNSCMNKTAIEEQSILQLLKIFKIAGNWPVLEEFYWNAKEFNWIETTYKLSDMGYSVDYFMTININIDVKNTSNHVIYLDQESSLEDSKNNHLSLKTLEEAEENLSMALFNYMINVAVALGAERHIAEYEMMDNLKFVSSLQEISLSKEQRRNVTNLYNPMTVLELSKKYPSIPWKEYFNRLLPSNTQIDDNQIVIVAVPSYIEKLETLIIKTPKKIIANYIMWKTVEASMNYLNDELQDIYFEFFKIASGQIKRDPRWMKCVAIVEKTLPLSIGGLYVRNHFNNMTKGKTIEMVNVIFDEFKKTLQELHWMDDETKVGALEKVEFISTQIAYPTFIMNDSKLEEFYKDLHILDENFLLTNLKIQKFSRDKYSSMLKNPVVKNDWVGFGSPSLVNGFYSIIDNAIQLPAGILQEFFFNIDRPEYMNYAALGAIIGHEIIHGFDDVGRMFDKSGGLVNWWVSSTKEKYLEMVDCMIEKYSNYTIKEFNNKVNGILTRGENIADNGGLKLAYFAYLNLLKRGKLEPRLFDLDFTTKQMFWISAANTWCEKSKPQLRVLLSDDVHSPSEFRVIGSLSNIPEFAKDFNCPEGSNMNPKKKCNVW